jgi:uncharacterized surface protein with fasciclin (FAS1) repeats
MNKRLIGLAGLAAAGALSLAACSSGSSSSSSTTSTGSSAASSSAAPSPSASSSSGDTTNTTFGSACSQIPTAATNPGSLASMARVPVATAASGNPILSTLVTAVKAAGLVDTLNTAPGVTVFAPDNAAFAKIPAATLQSVLANKAELTKILTYHVVGQKLSPDQVTGALKSLEGATIAVSGSKPEIKVNSANIVCGGIQTANATVYVIDSVLMPTS